MMDFTDLKIARGSGNFHVNQFRIHFSVPGLQGDPQKQLPLLVGEFIKDFPTFFNGLGKNMQENQASVAWSTRQFERTRTLRFLLDVKLAALGINLPDFHSDWVHVLWQDPNKGFAAQTLKRNFPEGAEKILQWMPGTLLHALIQYNAYHFLAGRRSWVFGLLQPGMPGWNGASLQVGKVEGGKFTAYSGSPTPVFYLESSAVERSSLLLYKLMEVDPGVVIDIRKTIISLWSILLANYVHSKGFRLNVVHPKAYGSDDGAVLWETQPEWRGVYRRKVEFKSAQELSAKKWVQHLLDLHPALKSQPLSDTTFKGFGGGNSGGGGASGSW
ncbi:MULTISPECIES: hypothetical protein [unclassified Corallococcus]|uniref:hypothetical protein n=1 Tax=unclassified Corallococcus TaxID=2685029 RepID=UPI001A8CC379|nr:MULTISPECIES: hypothetical protein [unclassified Corallococcus]MBN9686069.1 hypothetical protein [Corallococcus sp. NCSPR001]WAS82495.1 hypothetical protein O0N60_24565 [Corallococcus sp. NCRR]